MQALNRQTVTTHPSYPERIVQFGAGNFLRGFANWMIEILNEETKFGSSVVAIKPTPRGSYELLDKQAGLFHTRLYEVQEGELKTSTKLITCMRRTLNPYSNFDAFLALARQPELRFVISNTTESGIAFEASDAFSDAPPSSFPAKLTRFLFERFKHFEGAADKGLIILPCELIEDNGTQLKNIMLEYVKLWNLSEAFTDWLTKNNTFCNTLVDRIVTGFPKETSENIWQELSYRDKLLVDGEAYHSWIIEGPDWLKKELPTHQTKLNVTFTNNLSIQREIKVRILNGAHTAMVPVAYLYGERTVDAVMRNPLLHRFIHDLLYKEVLPTLSSPPEELERFAESTLNRFQNPTLKHQLSAIALNSTTKFQTRLLPSLLAYYEQTGQLPERIVFAFACLIRFYKGSWQSETTPVQDDANYLTAWQAIWKNSTSSAEMSQNVLARTDFWGQDLNTLNDLNSRLTHYLEALEHTQLPELLERFN